MYRSAKNNHVAVFLATKTIIHGGSKSMLYPVQRVSSDEYYKRFIQNRWDGKNMIGEHALDRADHLRAFNKL